jgi:hypothetical protein
MRAGALPLVISLLLATWSIGCMRVRFYNLKPSMNLADAKLAGVQPVISYDSVRVDPHVVVDAKSSGPRVAKFAEEWRDTTQKFDAAFLKNASTGPRFVANDANAPFALTVEVIRVESGEDMDPWLEGKKTWTYLLLTLWDQPQKRVLERFTIGSMGGGAWSFGDVGQTAALKTREYLAARFEGRGLEK